MSAIYALMRILETCAEWMHDKSYDLINIACALVLLVVTILVYIVLPGVIICALGRYMGWW